MIRRALRSRTLLTCAATMALAWPQMALAQNEDAPPPLPDESDGGPTPVNAQTAVDEAIVVTGSRVRGTAPVGASMISLDRDDIGNLETRCLDFTA